MPTAWRLRAQQAASVAHIEQTNADSQGRRRPSAAGIWSTRDGGAQHVPNCGVRGQPLMSHLQFAFASAVRRAPFSLHQQIAARTPGQTMMMMFLWQNGSSRRRLKQAWDRPPMWRPLQEHSNPNSRRRAELCKRSQKF